MNGDIRKEPPPQWFTLGDKLIGPLIGEASQQLKHYTATDFHTSQIPTLALTHLASCLTLSDTANRNGNHAIAISLLRQGVEAINIIELGFLDPSYSEPLLDALAEGRKTQGELRQELERKVWVRYGPGLWGETWSEFFGNLARAVQPYAHYSPDLLQWQIGWIMTPTPGQVKGIGGVNIYDPIKASRITVMHILTAWTLGRLIFENSPRPGQLVSKNQVQELGEALGECEFLFKGADWGTQLLPHMYFLNRGKSDSESPL